MYRCGEGAIEHLKFFFFWVFLIFGYGIGVDSFAPRQVTILELIFEILRFYFMLNSARFRSLFIGSARGRRRSNDRR
jgi:hypothetical protein